MYCEIILNELAPERVQNSDDLFTKWKAQGPEWMPQSR